MKKLQQKGRIGQDKSRRFGDVMQFDFGVERDFTMFRKSITGSNLSYFKEILSVFSVLDGIQIVIHRQRVVEIKSIMGFLKVKNNKITGGSIQVSISKVTVSYFLYKNLKMLQKRCKYTYTKFVPARKT